MSDQSQLYEYIVVNLSSPSGNMSLVWAVSTEDAAHRYVKMFYVRNLLGLPKNGEKATLFVAKRECGEEFLYTAPTIKKSLV